MPLNACPKRHPNFFLVLILLNKWKTISYNFAHPNYYRLKSKFHVRKNRDLGSEIITFYPAPLSCGPWYEACRVHSC